MENKESNNLALIFAFVAGALCGAIVGILLAPSSGETRKKIQEAKEKIKEKGADFVEKASTLIKEGKERVGRFVGEEKVKEKIAKAVEAGKKAMEEEIERIKSKA